MATDGFTGSASSSSRPLPRIGVIGLGLLGRALAQRFLQDGLDVCGFDIDSKAAAAARELGVDCVESAGDVARATYTIVLSLPDSSIRQDLLWGAQALAGDLAAGTLILDTTTGRPEDTESDHERLAEQDIRLIDVTVVGSSAEAAEGNAVALVGDLEDQANYAPIIETFAKRIFYLGAPGKGNQAKLIVNLVLGLNRLVLAEGLGLAAHAGFDLGQILEILKSGAAYSKVMDTKGRKMVDRQFNPVARLSQHAKDVGLIRELARQLGADVPLSALHARILEQAAAAGLGDLDNAAVVEMFLKSSEESP